MKRSATLVVITVLGALVVAAGAGCSTGGGTLEVRDAWMPEPAGDTGAVYLTIHNATGRADRLVATTAGFAERTELMRTERRANGLTSMHTIEAIPLPANGTVKLAPGGLHVMLYGLKPGINVGDRLQLRLRFARAGERTVTVAVRPMGDVGDMDDGGGMGGMGDMSGHG